MPTFTQIGTAQVVGAGGAPTISFSSIPSTYTDLVLITSLRKSASSANVVLMQFNSSSSNFTQRYIDGNGSTTTSASNTSGWAGLIIGTDYTANTFANNSVYITNYAGSTSKSYSVDQVTENNATTSYVGLVAGLWSNSAAINSITLTPADSSNFVQYSTAYLYGVSNA